jgi:hypothetical protein
MWGGGSLGENGGVMAEGVKDVGGGALGGNVGVMVQGARKVGGGGHKCGVMAQGANHLLCLVTHMTCVALDLFFL